jgi:uncharacterized membrane protein YgdD (TMEM256/DUF423 family)
VVDGRADAASPGPLPGWAAAALAAVLAALGVALGAYAAHAAEGRAAEWLRQASLYLLLHAPLLLALLGRHGRLLDWVRAGLLLGLALFCGSLIGAALFGWPTRLAPSGGLLLIASWLLLAVAVLRGEGGRA